MLAAASRGQTAVSSVLRRSKIPTAFNCRSTHHRLWQNRAEAPQTCGALSDQLRDEFNKRNGKDDQDANSEPVRHIAPLFTDFQCRRRKDILGGMHTCRQPRFDPLDSRNAESVFGYRSTSWNRNQHRYQDQSVNVDQRDWLTLTNGGQGPFRMSQQHSTLSLSLVPSQTRPPRARSSLFHGSLIPSQQSVCFFSTSSQQNSDSKDGSGEPKGKDANPSRVLSRSTIPTPDSAPPLDDNPLANLPEPKSLVRKGADLIIYLSKSLLKFLYKLPFNIFYYATHPAERKAYFTEIQDMIKHEINHYWVGTKLLWADVRTARDLFNKTLKGNPLTRRERKQLLRTVSDLFRLVPFSMFVILPFMEFALPFALRIFPNLLPSTFQDSLKAEENMKREVQSRIAMAQFFQETMEELAKEQKRKASRKREELIKAGVKLEEDGNDTIDKKADSAASMLEFLEKARNGEMIPPDVIIRYANYFQDDLTLDNMPRMQLINMCKYMAINPYGSDAFLRFQLRHKIRVLKEDDQRILWEGIDSLTKMELREACQERGMRSTGLSKDAYKTMLEQWLDLSVNKNVPIALLIMSRTFFLSEDVFKRKTGETEEAAEGDLTGLVDTISGLDKEVLNEVILEVATSEEKKSDPTIQKLKLEVVAKQNELIREEQEARDAAAAAAAKKKEETAAVSETISAPAAETETDSREHPVAEPSPETGSIAFVDEKVTDAAKEFIAPESAEDKMQIPTEEEETKDESEGEEERDLSTEEMDALEHFLTDDPVSKERKELEKLKATIKGEETDKEGADDDSTEPMPEPEEKVAGAFDTSTGETRVEAADTIPEEKQMTPKEVMPPAVLEEGEEPAQKPDPVVERLQKRIESMVDKIEVQLSDVELKIGDKLHLLDKDRDGILSKEEVAGVLQQVFKRKISPEEAMEIVDEMDMDRNEDGIITVDELLKWINENKLVKFVEEGRDHEMDKMMEDPGSVAAKEEPENSTASK